MRIIRHQAIQVHSVPNRVYDAKGPFPDELFDEPEIIYDYPEESGEDGADFELGATAQNNFKPAKYYRCRHCNARVTELELETHVCED